MYFSVVALHTLKLYEGYRSSQNAVLVIQLEISLSWNEMYDYFPFFQFFKT